MRRAVALSMLPLVLLAAAITVALGWMTTELNKATEDVLRDARSMEIAGDADRALRSFNRLSNLHRVDGGAEVAAERAQAESELRRLLVEARAHVGSAHESRVLDRAVTSFEDYRTRRGAAEQAGGSLESIIRVTEPALERCLASFEDLRLLNEAEVQHALRRSQQIDQAANAVAAGSVILLLLGLFGALLGLHRFVVRPLGGLRESIERYRRGDLAARADDRGPLEVAAVAGGFNELADTLARHREAQLAFLAGVAHDLRNPVFALKLGVSVLRDAGDTLGPKRIGEQLTRIDRQLEQLRRQIDDILDAARAEAGALDLHVEPFDLRELACEVASLYEPVSPSHPIHVELADQPVVVSCDSLRIEQCLGNLLSNAIKYSPAGGDVVISVKASDEEAELAVMDRGVGIAADELPELFTPFRRGEATRAMGPGAGIGLSVVKRIVEAHGGRIDVDSRRGSGSTFRVTLPRADRAFA